MRAPTRNAQVAKLVDALVSGTSAARCGGSSPLLGTIQSAVRPTKTGLYPGFRFAMFLPAPWRLPPGCRPGLCPAPASWRASPWRHSQAPGNASGALPRSATIALPWRAAPARPANQPSPSGTPRDAAACPQSAQSGSSGCPSALSSALRSARRPARGNPPESGSARSSPAARQSR